jgi:hypothetical protein
MATPKTGRPRGRPKGSPNKAKVEREAQMSAALAAAAAETPQAELMAWLPIDFLQRGAIAAYKAGNVKLWTEIADRWAQYVHAKKTDSSMAVTFEDVRHFAQQAREEAARRRLDLEIAERPVAGTLPN